MEKVFARVRLYLEISVAVARTSQSPFPLAAMVADTLPRPNGQKNKQTMTQDKDLIFVQRTFFCFSATAQVAHLVLPDTQTNTSQNQKSHFLPTQLPSFKTNS